VSRAFGRDFNKERTLRDKTNVVSETLLSNISNLVSINEDASTSCLIESVEQSHCNISRFSSSDCTSDAKDEDTY